MRYPGRGRKPNFPFDRYWKTILLRNEIPRKGTETVLFFVQKQMYSTLRNEIPRKGTETLMNKHLAACRNYWEMRYPGRGRKRIPVLFESTQLPLRNEIPRKGTETEEKRMLNKAELQLRNEIPRKGTETLPNMILSLQILLRNEIPRKGTETIVMLLHLPIELYWEMRYPGRGRKHACVFVPIISNDWEMRYPGRGRKL